MKYIVNQTCFFQNRLYEKGDEVDFEPASNVPEWFTPVGEPEHEPPEKEPEIAKRPPAGGKTKNKG